MNDTTQRTGLFTSTVAARGVGLGLLLSILSAGVAPVALAGDAEITLKFASLVPADTLAGRVDLGGTALVGVEPEEIDVAYAGTAGAGAATSGQAAITLGSSTVSLEGIILGGLSPDDVVFDREGLAEVIVEALALTFGGHQVTGYEYDDLGRLVSTTHAASLVLEPASALLRSQSGQVLMDVTFVLVDVVHDGGRGFEPARLVLNGRASFDKQTTLRTNLPDHIQSSTGTTESAACNGVTGMCACGDSGGCNSLLAACFHYDVNGSWDCLMYNEQGQCVLGTCDMGF